MLRRKRLRARGFVPPEATREPATLPGPAPLVAGP